MWLMIRKPIIFLLFGLNFLVLAADDVDYDQILREENEKLRLQRNAIALIRWNYESNITEYNQNVLMEATKEFDKFLKEQARTINSYLNDANNMNKDQRRQFQIMSFLGFSSLPEKEHTELKLAQMEMERVYSTSKIDLGHRKGLQLEPELNALLKESTQEPILKEIWVKWRDASGKKMRKTFLEYVELGNKAARMNKVMGKEFKTIDDMWMFEWENDKLKEEVEVLVNDLMGLYQKIHAYVRFHLGKVYKMPTDGTIPAHLLGNMWAQTWGNLLGLIPSMQFHTDVPSLDKIVDERLKNLSVKQMFQLSESFFTSLGMKNMTEKFWQNSILERRPGVEMVCHASAWDFFDGSDFRIKQCTEKTLNDLVTVHHEMGHVQYYMNYAAQPAAYRDGANPGFHEAIGDLMALAVSTPEHLTKINLLDKTAVSNKLDAMNLNYQLRMALDKIVFLPYAFIMDKWRWDIFSDEKIRENMNRHWWELRLKYQGISPPVKRSEQDFDPGSKYHIPGGVEYIRYFVSHILQFQFYKHMCLSVPGVRNLYQCDFYNNLQAGRGLINMMKKGYSEHWETVLKDFIGISKFDLGPLYEYFQPLNDTLNIFIRENNIKVGWDAKVDDYWDSSNSSSNQIYPSLLVAFVLILISFSYLFIF